MPALVAKAAEAPEVEAAEAKAAYDLRCCLLIRLVPQQVIDSSCIAGSSGCG